MSHHRERPQTESWEDEPLVKALDRPIPMGNSSYSVQYLELFGQPVPDVEAALTRSPWLLEPVTQCQAPREVALAVNQVDVHCRTPYEATAEELPRELPTWVLVPLGHRAAPNRPSGWHLGWRDSS